jgi:uncharacterized protein YndB with AHSA1/START domain
MEKEDSISIEIIFQAPIENVWNAWTDSSLILLWFGSEPKGKGLKAKMDVRAGGSFEITFANSDGAVHTCYGVYTEVKPFSKLSFTWNWKAEPGVESFVTVLLSSENNFTRMKFEHTHVGNASAHNYTEGWRTTFKKLEQVLTK